MKTFNLHSTSFLFIILLNILFFSELSATQLAYDRFQHNSSSGYSRDDGWNNQLKIKGYAYSYKWYYLGNSYANSNLTVTFKVKWRGGWESSGKWQDYFKVYLNGDMVVKDSFSGNGGWRGYTTTATADADGDLSVLFYADTTSVWEYIVIDDVKITGIANTFTTDLSITSLTDTPNLVDVGTDITYSVGIRNRGLDSNNNTLRLTSSDALFVSMSQAGWNCSGAGTKVATCTKATIPNNNSETLDFIFKAPSTAKTISLVANLSSNTIDINPRNNTKTIHTDVVNNNIILVPPVDEIIPHDSADVTTVTCDTFADGLQTRGSNSRVDFSSGSAKLYNNPDTNLNTFNAPVNGGSGNDITCNNNANGDADTTCSVNSQSATTIPSITIKYPATFNLAIPVTASATDIVYNPTNATLLNSQYNNISSHWNSGTITAINFSTTNRLYVNTLNPSGAKQAQVSFSSANGNPYSITIGDLRLARTTISTNDTNSKNIYINNITANDAHNNFNMSATQTIKINSLTTKHSSSYIFSAPYVNINTITDSSGNGQENHIKIKADYIDIGEFNVGDATTIDIEPYTSGQKVIVKMNSFNTGSNNVINFSKGTYYIKTLNTSGSGSGYKWNMNGVVTILLEDDWSSNSAIAINADAIGGSGVGSDTHTSTDLFIYSKGNITTTNNTRIVGTIYSEGNVRLESSSYIKGAVSANNLIYLGNATEVHYDQDISSGSGGECITDTPINTREFTKVLVNNTQNLNIYGSLLVIGNQLLCQNRADGAICERPNPSSTNNGIYQHHAKVDKTSTLSSNSMARLDLQTGDKVIWAGLYWSARIYSSSYHHPDASKISMKVPGSSTYKQYSSEPRKFNWYKSGSVFDYACMRDVTADVKSAGEYYVGGIEASNGKNQFASWALLVVVENQKRSFKNISIYDGFKAVYSGSGYPTSIDVSASGFLTPRENTVESNLVVYTGESEMGLRDSATITDRSGNQHSLIDPHNNSNDIFNASISTNGVFRSDYRVSDPTLANPNFQNVIGTDIDKLPITGLDNLQTSTNIKITSKGDRFTLNMFAFETELYIPKFCYDYAYTQDGVYFTEPNDGTKEPMLIGDVNPGHSIGMQIYIKNQVASDIQVSNFSVSVLDINNSQVSYIPESTYLTPINGIIPEHISDSSLSEVSSSYIKGLPIGAIGSNEYFYFYYSLNPTSSSIDTPITIKATYDLSIAGQIIPYNLILGSKIDLCTDNNFRYQPARSIFNVVHNNYYNNSTSYYNLPTQITKREGNFKVISLDPEHLDTLVGRSTVVAVEMIDAAAFHDTNASCQQKSSSITPRVWVTFDNNVSSTQFNQQTLQDAINNGLTTLSNSADFYATARANTAFRVSYNAVDTNGSLVQFNKDANGNYQIINFTELVQGLNVCAQDVDGNPNNIDTIANYCGNSGTGGGSTLTRTQLSQCMECVYGYRTKFICSRDNFSIRPESFLIKINDRNQTDDTQKIRLADNVSGVTSPTSEILNLAAGYDYNIEVNATNHKNNDASNGYTKTFNAESTFDRARYIWEPRAGSVTSGCNDTNDTQYVYKFTNGKINSNLAMEQIGDYRFNMLDTSWTSVDYIPAYMVHHTGNHFKSGADCIKNSSNTEIVNSQNTNGCNISSSHVNSDARDIKNNVISLSYNDYNVTLHPYYFDTTAIGATFSPDNIQLTDGSFIYMADMSKDENMSIHFNGNIVARSYTDEPLSNFVNNCFAKPLDINISKDFNKTIDTDFQYRFKTTTNNGAIDTNQSNGDLNNNTKLVSANTTLFVKELNGTAKTILNLNFNRTVNNAVNPNSVTFSSYNVKCSVQNDCTSSANLGTVVTKGSKDINKTVNFYYARNNSKRQVFTTPKGTLTDPENALIYYEVYCDGVGCDKTLLQDGLDSNISDDPRWFINSKHTSIYGSAGSITQKNATNVIATKSTGNTPDSTSIYYKANRGYPYKATMSTNSSPWLIYNKYQPTAKTNEFDVEFINASTSWAGKNDANSTTNTKASSTTNRRSMW